MRLFLLPLVLIGAYYFYLTDPFFYGTRLDDLEPKRHANDQPLQKPLALPKSLFLKDHTLKFHHHFSMTGLVLSSAHYNSDRLAQFSPVDLALGWGPMSNPNPLRLIKITQSNRFYFFRYRNQPPIAHQQIIQNSANMHLIPANGAVAKTLKAAEKGDIIEFSGYLVDIFGNDGWYWKSSRTRSDTGKGACELIYVEKAVIR